MFSRVDALSIITDKRHPVGSLATIALIVCALSVLSSLVTPAPAMATTAPMTGGPFCQGALSGSSTDLGPAVPPVLLHGFSLGTPSEVSALAVSIVPVEVAPPPPTPTGHLRI